MADRANIEWLKPWQSCDEPLEEQLKLEIAHGHPLYSRTVRCEGRRIDNDDVLFSVEGGTASFAVVHLTWIQEPGSPEYPETTFYNSIQAWISDCMVPDHEDWSGKKEG